MAWGLLFGIAAFEAALVFLVSLEVISALSDPGSIPAYVCISLAMLVFFSDWESDSSRMVRIAINEQTDGHERESG